MNAATSLWLASRSPRRRELLAQLGIEPRLLAVDVPEQQAAGEPAADYVARVARAKAEAGQALLGGQERGLVLAADTEVVLDEQVFGKPHDGADAAAMLARLAGREHRVLSAVVLLGAATPLAASCASTVRLAPLSADEIAAYVASGEPFGKAGGYAIQGRAAAFIEHLSGSYSGVMGLPLHETAELLRSAGFPLATPETGHQIHVR